MYNGGRKRIGWAVGILVGRSVCGCASHQQQQQRGT